ncbi:MAG: hypothetical protein GQ555_04350 [Desulfobacterales bacterium]|nr:hypothetical protein [Desulfobacterales bacterium]
MKSLKNNHKLGAALAVIGILIGFLVLYLIAITYIPVVEGKILDGRPDEAITVRIVHSLMGWVGMSGGAIWAVVLFGFLNKKEWSWSLGVVAGTMQLLAGFFPMIPPASIGMPTPTIWVFLIAFMLWFGMLFIGGVKNKIITLAFVSGLAYVMIFIDGVGAISRYQTVKESTLIGMYAMGLVVTLWAAAAWAVFIYFLVKGKSWTLEVGIFAASLSIIAGLPVGLTDVVRLSRFSMFLPGPMLSAILLVVILLPGTKKLISDWIEAEA